MKRTLRCGYHAWTYDLGGRLVAAPNLAKMAGIDRGRYGLLPVQLRKWLGYAWVCLAGEPPSFEDTVIGAVTERLGDPDAIEHYQVRDLALGQRITYDVAANWKLIVENFMECYHCAAIHPELTGDRSATKDTASCGSSKGRLPMPVNAPPGTNGPARSGSPPVIVMSRPLGRPGWLAASGVTSRRPARDPGRVPRRRWRSTGPRRCPTASRRAPPPRPR